jgi:hypothetical protein
VTYTGDTDPRKIRDAKFLAVQCEAARQSLAKKDELPRLEDMALNAKRVARSVARRKRCTDAQMKKLSRLLRGVRKWVHGGDA